MIVFHSVSKDVGRGALKRRVLADINWKIPRKAHVVVLGHTGAGKTLLLSLMAGLSTPTVGWVERPAVVSLPGGVLRFGVHQTPRTLIYRMSEIYRVDPKDVTNFLALFPPIRDVLDIHLNRLRGTIRAQLNAALTYALPCDYYLFDGNIAPGRDHAFQKFCREAFSIRRAQGATIVTANSVKAARGINYEASGALLFRGNLYLFKTLPEAIAVFEKVPVEAAPADFRPPAAPESESPDDFL